MWLIDPSYALTPPHRSSTLHPSLWTKFTVVLATWFMKTASAIRKLIPQTIKVVEYGQIRQSDGGDNIQAWELVPLAADGRDMSFVQICQMYHVYNSMHSYSSCFISVSTLRGYLHSYKTKETQVWIAQLLQTAPQNICHRHARLSTGRR